MTQEEKQLLLKDLCARLPYGVKVHIEHDTFYDEREPYNSTLSTRIINDFIRFDKLEVKPYLRPMSSMTEEEETWATASYDYNKLTYGMDYAITAYVDYLYSIHIDCHNLIPKCLALVSPKDMYNTKTE